MTELEQKFLDFCKNEEPKPFIPTKQQMQAIFGKTNIVAAGAGSGKTAVLSHRFLYLVMKGIHSDEILTMTFTKDATASMKKKIHSLLSAACEAKIISSKELDKFTGATITTTDGFCSEIAKSACSDYGISPNFQIESDTDLELVSEQLTNQILGLHENDEQLKILLSVWRVDSVKEFFKELTRNFITVSNQVDFSRYRNYVLSKFKDYTYEGLEALLQDFSELAAEDTKPSATQKANNRIVEQYLKEPNCENLQQLQKLKANCKLFLKPITNEIKDYSANLIVISEDNLAMLDYIALLCTDFQSAVVKHKRETGLLTYHDVLLMAIDILKNREEIRAYYRNKFKAIMVDEFQDNNEDNKNLVYLVAQNIEDEVFMVGDEKQSIYLFRNADVSVFKKMTREFGEDRVTQLQQNYRSEGRLIETINSIFDGVFAGSSKDYEASYTPLFSENNHVEPKVCLYYYSDSEHDPDKDAEAYNTAKVIHEILNEKRHEYRIPTKDGLRDPQPSDIAILLKVGSHQISYEKALRSYNIAFESAESKSLTLDAITNDFYNTIQLAVWGKNDDVAWQSFLYSPLAYNRTKEETDEILRKVRNSLEYSKLTKTISLIWNDLGYRFFILRDKKNHCFEEHYSYLFSLASSFDQSGKTAVDFLDYLRPMLNKECKIKDLVVQRERESGVKIMTIHKSKGLEYPIVIVPDMHSGSRELGGFKPNIRLQDGIVTYPFVLPNLVNPCIEKDDEKEKDAAETKRVFYVAATRAQYHLIFSGVKRETNSMYAFLLNAVDFDGDRNPKLEYVPFDNSVLNTTGEQSDILNVGEEVYQDTYNFSYKKLTSAITSLDIDKETSFSSPLPLYDSDRVITSWTEFGTYVHSLLERTVLNLDTENYYGSYEVNADRDTIKHDALSMRDNFINSSFYKNLAGYELYTEKGFFYFDEQTGDVMEGIADLLCVGPEKVIIVDYKTDKFKDPSTHKGQLETYAKAMKDKYKKEVECYLFYVRSGEAEKLEFDS